MSTSVDRFGRVYAHPPGYIVEAGESKFKHRFGGVSWHIVSNPHSNDVPALLFVLDLADPRLSSLRTNSIPELPVCSYINCDLWRHEQIYEIHNATKEVFQLSGVTGDAYIMKDEDRLPNPLPEKKVYLREMKASEYPLDEGAYWKNTDDFLGGNTFFRLGGRPLWLQEARTVTCTCASDMKYVMSIGYEGWDGPYRYINQEPFFIGEAALYVFFCVSCLQIRVISQSS